MEVLDVDDARALARTDNGAHDHFSVVSAEINQQVATARKHPRSVDNFQKRLKSQALLNQSIAAQCTYKKPRGGKVIEGPSVRFMEMVIANWGNCRAGAQVIAETETTVVAQGVFHDLESNVAITFTYSRSILDNKKKRFDADMIQTTIAAATSIAFRNVVQKGVPKALWVDIHEESKRVALGDLTTLAQRRQNALDWFKALGVTEKQITETLGIVGVADIDLDKLAILGGFKVAIEDEGADPEELFVAVDSKTASTRGATKKAAATAPKPPTEDTPPAPQSGAKASGNAADAGNGAASPPVVAKTAEAADAALPEDPTSIAVTSPETAARFAAAMTEAVNAAKTVDAIDDLHGRVMKSGQWRALQTHDPKAYANIANVMTDRSAAFEQQDTQQPPD